MTARYKTGVATPPVARAYFDGGVFSYAELTVMVQEVSLYAGAAIGNAVIAYPHVYADDATPDLGRAVRIKYGPHWIFRGVVGRAPIQVGTGADQVELLLWCDKWLMANKTIGQPGIGTIGTPAGSEGFQDVGFDCCFNKGGRPNKAVASREFNTGPGAAWWTLEDIMLWIFDYYIETTVAQISAASLSSAYAEMPTDLTLTGMTALAAVDTVAALAGESWGLQPGSAYSTWVPVRPGTGTAKTLRLFRPRGQARASDATAYHVGAITIETNIQNVRDVYQAVSAPIVKETTYTNTGANPLFSRQLAWTDGDYVQRYNVNVLEYENNSLGKNLTDGSPPKPWLQQLVTRRTAAGAYVTAADIAADSAMAREQPLAPLLWLAVDGVAANAKRVTGGFRIDTEHGTLDLKGTVQLLDDTADESADQAIADWSVVGVWLTVATVLEIPKYAETAAGARYLPQPAYGVIPKTDLVPEQRRTAWLPDLAGGNNDVAIASDGADEDYVSVDADLAAAANAALSATAAIEVTLDIECPFAPVFGIGDRIAIAGRSLGQTGNEVVTQITYRIYEQHESRIRATNVVGEMDPSQFREPE